MARPPAVKRSAPASAAVHIRGPKGFEIRGSRGAGRLGTGHGVASNSEAGKGWGASSARTGAPSVVRSVSDIVSSMVVEAIIPPSASDSKAQAQTCPGRGQTPSTDAMVDVVSVCEAMLYVNVLPSG